MYLENINSPADVKKLSVGELTSLCAEMREALIQKLSVHGGHVGPNLGMVEATVAMHYVMNSPVDKFVFDVSHQSYAHKMLTGRKEAFTNPDCYDEVSGYTEPSESVHDHFVIGHTSTSVSLASGLAKARDLRGERFNVVAVIGDGSLSGGEAFEGLDVAAELGSNMIVVVNDNQMSIAENHGGLYRNLQLLRETNGEASCNFFKAMGFDYLYVADGNDVEAMIEAFSRVRDIDHPIVLHINTLKGKGYRFADYDCRRDKIFMLEIFLPDENGDDRSPGPRTDHAGARLKDCISRVFSRVASTLREHSAVAAALEQMKHMLDGSDVSLRAVDRESPEGLDHQIEYRDLKELLLRHIADLMSLEGNADLYRVGCGEVI